MPRGVGSGETIKKTKTAEWRQERARKAGKASTYRPFKDPEKARAAVQKRWAKYRLEKAKTVDKLNLHDDKK